MKQEILKKHGIENPSKELLLAMDKYAVAKVSQELKRVRKRKYLELNLKNGYDEK
jgi:hypothetical protein